MKKLLLNFILIFSLIAGFHIDTLSQNVYRLSGKVVDMQSGEVLPGASIKIKGSSKGVVSNQYGMFEIKDIQNKIIELTVFYMGYENENVNIDFDHKNSKRITIRLKSSSLNYDEVNVTGKSQGQVKALIEQKNAANIKNIVSAEQISEFPDVNAAEAIQRIPGVTIQRDQGEGRFVQLRGTAPEFTNFNINGEQIPSPEGNVRFVGLDVISADQIELIEVTKVLTPDMDGDGIAGNVNIITKSAQDSIPDIKASFTAGYNNLLGTYNQQLQFSFGQRYKKLGFQMSASYYNNDQGAHNMEYDYTRGPTTQLSQNLDSTEQNYQILYKDIELRHYTINRQRIGLSANLDYEFNDHHQLYFRAMYNQFIDDETRRRFSYKLSDANTPLEYREAGIERDIKDRVKTQTIATLNLGAKHEFPNKMKLDYEVALSMAKEETPNTMYVSFNNGGITMAIDRSDPTWPVVSFPYENDYIDAYTYTNYEFDDLMFIDGLVTDNNYTSKINLEIPYMETKKQKGFIKLGGKVRIKNKERDNTAQAYNLYFEELSSIYYSIAPELNLTTVTDDFVERNLLGHGYIIEEMIGPEVMRDFFEAHPQHFKYDEEESFEKSYGEDYVANENIYATYIMAQHDISNLMILGGIRYEYTEINNQGYLTELLAIGRGVLNKDSIIDKRHKGFILPQLQFKYMLDEKTNLRLAATYTYTRPNFEDLIPYRSEYDKEVKVGNPDLRYPVSFNLDLLAERYLNNKGLLSGGLFYKKIDDIAFIFTRNAHEGEDYSLYPLVEITMAVNGQYANVYGAEVQSQFKLSFLPGFLKDFGLFGNYTFTESDAYITKRYPQNDNDVEFTFNEDDATFFTSSGETEVIPLPGQAKHAFNLSLYYDVKRLYCKLSGNYHSPFLTALGNDAELDVYTDKSFHLDFTTNYQLTETLNVFVDLLNITNAPLRLYMGSTDYFKQQEYYSWGVRVGVKIDL